MCEQNDSYLLECEIVGGEVSSEDKKVIVKPTQICPKSAWIGIVNDHAVLFEVEESSFTIKNPVEVSLLELNGDGMLNLDVDQSVCIYSLLNRSWTKVVLRLESNKKTVIGFKALY